MDGAGPNIECSIAACSCNNRLRRFICFIRRRYVAVRLVQRSGVGPCQTQLRYQPIPNSGIGERHAGDEPEPRILSPRIVSHRAGTRQEPRQGSIELRCGSGELEEQIDLGMTESQILVREDGVFNRDLSFSIPFSPNPREF